MLPVPKLDTQSFKEIYEKMNRQTLASGTMTDSSYQDPGRTLMEVFALLLDMQRFYMDFISDEYREKYARLLGASPPVIIPASTVLAISPPGGLKVFPVGYPFYFGDIPFETVERLDISENKLVSVETSVSRGETVLKLGFSKDLSGSPVNRVYLCFDQPIEPLAYSMDSWDGKYTAKDGSARNVVMYGKNVSDGYLRFGVTEPMYCDDGVFYVTLAMKSDFMIPPKIELARINAVKARQVKTWCDYYDVTTDKTGVFALESYLAFYGELEILECVSRGFRRIEPDNYEVARSEDEGRVTCKITTEGSAGKRYRVLCRDKGYAGKFVFETTVQPGQAISLEVSGLMWEVLEIMTESAENAGLWTEWKRVGSLRASRGADRHFVVKNGCVCFGNHENGEIPGTGVLKVIRCAVSLGAGGNVRRGEINTGFAENVIPSEGGMDAGLWPPKTLPAPGIKKAVTLNDYREILCCMPAPELDRIDVGTEPCAGGMTVRVYASPVSDIPRPGLSEAYIKNILAYLEPYRMIATKLTVGPVEYIPFTVELSAEFYSEYANPEDIVIRKLAEAFPYEDNMVRREFAERIGYREVYTCVRGASCVKKIHSLSIVTGSEGNEVSYIQLKAGQLAYLALVKFKSIRPWRALPSKPPARDIVP